MIKTIGLLLLALLKILGMIVLVLILLVTVSLLLAIFVPVRYRLAAQNGRAYTPAVPAGNKNGDGSWKNFRVQVRVAWLLHFIHFSLEYDSNADGIVNSIRVAGIDVLKVLAWFSRWKAGRQGRKAKKGRRKATGQTDTGADHTVSDMEPIVEPSEDRISDSTPSEDAQAKDTEMHSQTQPDGPASAAQPDDTRSGAAPNGPSGNSRREKKGAKKKPAKEKPATDKNVHSGFRAKAAAAKDKCRKFHKEFTDEANRSTVVHLWKELCYLLRNYKPRKLQADITYSLADPAITGEVLGAISLLPFIYRYPCRIEPDFISEQLYVEGELMMEGKVTVCIFLVSLFRLVRDKNVMQSVRRLQGK